MPEEKDQGFDPRPRSAALVYLNPLVRGPPQVDGGKWPQVTPIYRRPVASRSIISGELFPILLTVKRSLSRDEYVPFGCHLRGTQNIFMKWGNPLMTHRSSDCLAGITESKL